MLKTAAIKALRLVASRWPRAGYALARTSAWLSQPLARGVTETRLAALFPELSRPELRIARRRAWSTFLRGEALDAAMARPGLRQVYPRILPNAELARLRPPLILASFHVGPVAALGATLRQLPGDVLVVHHGEFAPREGITLLDTGENEWDRARAFAGVVRALRSGSFVFTVADGYTEEHGYAGQTLEAPVLGGTVVLARGTFALARMTRTPIVPLFARWRGNAVEVTCADPISPEGDEADIAAGAGRCLERYLREFPGEVSPRTLEVLRLPAPR